MADYAGPQAFLQEKRQYVTEGIIRIQEREQTRVVGCCFGRFFFVAPMFLTWPFPEISGQKHGKLLFWMFQKKTTEVIRIWWLAIQVLSILYPIGIHQDGYGDSKEPSVSPEAVHALLGKD